MCACPVPSAFRRIGSGVADTLYPVRIFFQPSTISFGLKIDIRKKQNKLFLIRVFDASGADFHSLAANSHILQIYLLGAFGSDIGMASALG